MTMMTRWRVIIPPSSGSVSRSRLRVNMKVVLPVIWAVSCLLVAPYAKFISHFYLDVSRAEYPVFMSSIPGLVTAALLTRPFKLVPLV